MTTMIPDLVVGQVGFGHDFGASAELEFYRDADHRHTAEITALRAENSELVRRVNRLRRALERCAALSEDVANEKHEALLEATQRR